jgi:hypothetical protein
VVRLCRCKRKGITVGGVLWAVAGDAGCVTDEIGGQWQAWRRALGSVLALERPYWPSGVFGVAHAVLFLRVVFGGTCAPQFLAGFPAGPHAGPRPTASAAADMAVVTFAHDARAVEPRG